MGKKNKLIKGLCHGVFDLVHIGHIRHFSEAKKYCNHLVISITSDKFVKKSKGPNKPIFNQNERYNNHGRIKSSNIQKSSYGRNSICFKRRLEKSNFNQ